MSKKTSIVRQSKILAKIISREYPQLFTFDSPAPLARGINQQICEAFPKVRRKVVQRFLWFWCNRHRYHLAVAQEGSVRLNLDGTVSEPVSDSHRQFAVEKAQQIAERREAKA